VTLGELLEDSRWLRQGLQIASGVIVVGVLVFGGVAWYRSHEARGAATVAEAASQAQQATTPESRDQATRALEAALAEYPRAGGVQQAAYELGNLKYQAGQYGPARGAFELAVAKGGSPSVTALARMGIAYTWEAEKNYANAAQAYAAVSRGLGPSAFMREEALMSEARADELAGKPAAAIEIYERLLKESPSGRSSEEIKARLASVKSRPTK
jgi:tetratricopeptide (TPR) repeat protein